MNYGKEKKIVDEERTCRCQLWSEVVDGIVASSFFFLFFFFFFFFSSIAQRSRCVNVYRRLFEYGHYYENRKHDNHESLPEVRTMSSSEILGCGLAQTAIKRLLNDNTETRRTVSPVAWPACHRVTLISVISEIVTKPCKHLFY